MGSETGSKDLSPGPVLLVLSDSKAVMTDQNCGIEQVRNSYDRQPAHSSPEPTAVLQLAERQCLTLRQVELNVPLRQCLQVENGEADGGG